MVEEMNSSDAKEPQRTSFRSSLQLAWQAILLQEKAYLALKQAPRPSRRGFITLLSILVIVASANSAGLVMDYLTLPRIDLVEQTLGEFFAQTKFYQEQLASKPNIAANFALLYQLVWFVLRWMGKYPSAWGVVSTFLFTIVLGILNWVAFSLIGHMIAKRLGGQAERSTFFGAMGLVQAPMLFHVAGIIPGLAVPSGMIGLWVMAATYQAARTVYELSWGRSVLIVLLPYLISIILLVTSVTLGFYLGVTVSQYL
jgi:hypothetical protein